MVTNASHYRGPVAATGCHAFPFDSPSGSSAGVTVIPANTNDGGIADRLNVHAASSCSNCMKGFFSGVRDFFAHRYADMRMFCRALNSMGGSTTIQDIDRRIRHIYGFRDALSRADYGVRAAYSNYQRLSTRTRNLFFYVNNDYMQHFLTQTNPTEIERSRQEILRESQQAISYQRMLMPVNTFFRSLSSMNRSSTSTVRRRRVVVAPPENRSWGLMANRLASVFGRAQSPPAARVGRVIPAETTAAAFDLNIPGTVPYIRDAIPDAVQQKANEIEELKVQFEALENPPAIPEAFEDPIMSDIMEIPVFDASHHLVQSGLVALRASVAAGGEEATAALATSRTMRHTVEKDSLERHIATGRSFAPAKCPTCRHPEDGGIRREYLRIDTQLQDDTLAFLRRAVQAQPAGAAAA